MYKYEMIAEEIQKKIKDKGWTFPAGYKTATGNGNV